MDARANSSPDAEILGYRNQQKHVDLPSSLNRDRVLDSSQSAKLLGISVPHFRRLYRAKKVPAPIKIGYRKYGWQVGVLIDFMAAKTEKAA